MDPLTGMALQLGGSMASYYLQNQANQSAFQQNKDFWNYTNMVTRTQAIQDRDFANSYNSPEAQMRRYREAGLNPNLIYGNASNMPSAQVRGSESQQGNLSPVRIDPNMIGSAINQYFDVMRSRQEINNMKKQADVLDSIKHLNDNKALTELLRPGWIKSQIESMDTKTDLGKQSLDYKSQLFPGQLSMQELLHNKVRQEINTSITQQEFNNAKTQTENELRQGRYDLMQANIDLTKARKEGTYQQIKESEQKVLNLINVT